MRAIEYKGQRVITTAMLAEAYQTNIKRISQNFSANQRHFVDGIHYFYLTGDELKAFSNYSALSGLVKPGTHHLYLWTERGANRHCKILDTDKAWEQFDHLEETYFRVKEVMNTLPNPSTLKYLNGLANYLRIQRTIMLDSGCTAQEVALMDRMTCESYGIPVLESLGEPHTYEQLYLQATTEHPSLEKGGLA